MSEQSTLPGEASLSLAARLQDITETLAATRDQDQVFEIVLRPALQALGAVAGTVLLVNRADHRLEVTAAQGDTGGEGPSGRTGRWTTRSRPETLCCDVRRCSSAIHGT